MQLFFRVGLMLQLSPSWLPENLMQGKSIWATGLAAVGHLRGQCARHQCGHGPPASGESFWLVVVGTEGYINVKKFNISCSGVQTEGRS